MVDSENRFKFVRLQISLPTLIINPAKFFTMIYCKAIIIIVAGIYFTGFT